jgi:hypothetical protein
MNHTKTMDFNSTDDLKQFGFKGFLKMQELFVNSSSIPKRMGVYLVLRESKDPIRFLTVGSGGFFKGRNPNVTEEMLKSNWVDDSAVVYIGKAGATGKKATLQSRLRQYFGFGQGRNIGHWGGRLIWQIEKAEDLVICWKETDDEEPREVEARLIRQFTSQFSKRPFANLKD